MAKKNTQKERVASELMEINKDLTEKDRADFRDEERVSGTTLSLYMNGKVANIDLAIKMLLFFRNRIQEREKLINA